MTPVVLSLALASPAHGVDVVWRGDARCPEHGFQDSLARYLAGAAEPRPVRVEVTVRRDGDARWSASLELAAAGARSTRELGGRSCAEVSDAAAFVTAIVADPDALARAAMVPAPGGDSMTQGTGEAPAGDAAARPGEASGPAPGGSDMSPGTLGDRGPGAASGPPGGSDMSPGTLGDRGPGAASGPPGGSDMSPGTPGDRAAPGELLAEPLPVEPPPAAGPPELRRGFVRVAGGFEAFGLPRIGPQAALAGGVMGRGWRVELTALYRAPTTRYSELVPTAGARVRMWAIGARGCGVPRTGRVEFPLCAGFEVGQAIGEGVGYVGARRDRVVWAAAVLGPALAWAPRPWLALWLGVDVGLPLVRGSFETTGLGTMFEIAPVSLRGALGIELRFGARGTHGSAASRETTAGPP